MMKRRLIGLCLWSLVECFTGGLASHLSLTFSPPDERIFMVTLYALPNCPHAQAILPQLETWIAFQGFAAWEAKLPTGFYPSPTLRIEFESYGVNYIGKNEILSFIL
jgi:hypothetical protein